MYDDYLDELLEEAYLEGYYDSMDDYNDYYMERKSTVHPAYDRNIDSLDNSSNAAVYYSKYYPHKKEIYKKLEYKYYKDKNTLMRYRQKYNKLSNNKFDAYVDRARKDAEYLKSKKGALVQ